MKKSAGSSQSQSRSSASKSKSAGASATPGVASKVTASVRPKSQILRDIKTGQVFLVNTLAETGDTLLWEDGKEYPLVDIEITGTNQLVAQPLEIPQIPVEVQLVTKMTRHTLH